MAGNFVYSFNEGSKDMRALLGGKGADLAEMTKIGLPVPFGFTVTTEACRDYYRQGRKLSDEIVIDIENKLHELEAVTGKRFGDQSAPLLVSVRSGAPVSMPGMMDSILDLGMNDRIARALAELTGNRRFAFDSYRRFIEMYGNVVLNIPEADFREILSAVVGVKGCGTEAGLEAGDLEAIVSEYKELILAETGKPLPDDPQDQLIGAIESVLDSWTSDRAVLYRKINNISDDLGTAVNVQAMVYGNMGDRSGSGVAFSRSPVNGDKNIYGEFLLNSQGQDVVSGSRTPERITEMAEQLPDAYKSFVKICEVLEQHYQDMQDMEFTIEEGKLYILQTRSTKRTARAAVTAAVDMAEEGLIDKSTAVMRISADDVDQLLHEEFDEGELKTAEVITRGLAASSGAASGKVCLDINKAVQMKSRGEKVILVRKETSPEDLAGMVSAEGLITTVGGITSHAAVVARGMGKCCVSACSDIEIDTENNCFTVGGKTYKEGDTISVDGTTGVIYNGAVKMNPPELTGKFGKILSWADDIRALKVRANCDTPEEVKQGDIFGAQGVGLCRTEHMFFSKVRIPEFREMILAKDKEGRERALKKLLPYQRDDFIEMFRVLKERPFTIRLLDPPLHEFLPNTENEMRALADRLNMSYDEVYDRCESLRELNPMMGMRGVRVAVVYPEIVMMQTEAIISAAIKVRSELNIDIVPEIMIPLVQNTNELKTVKKVIDQAADIIMKDLGETIDYRVGTMIETPRAALTADQIASEVEFFSFGTNDLTQMTLGFSRDDTAELIKTYIDLGIMDKDPFKSLDIGGVGRLIEGGTRLGRKTRQNISIGICGEQAGDPESIEFFSSIGLNYVSCSPYRVPQARLAAAHAAIIESRKKSAD